MEARPTAIQRLLALAVAGCVLVFLAWAQEPGIREALTKADIASLNRASPSKERGCVISFQPCLL